MTTVPLAWTASPSARSASALAAAAVLLGAWTGRGAVALAAAPLLAWLHFALRERRPDHIAVELDVDDGHCAEHDTVTLTLRASAVGAQLRAELRVDDDAALTLPAVAERVRSADGEHCWVWRVTMNRWGRRRPGVVELMLETPRGGWVATRRLIAPTVVVAPRLAGGEDHLDLVGVVRRPLYGPHPTATSGTSSEFLGVRPWSAGEPVGRLAWAATLRTGRWHVPTYAADRSQDVVVVVDAIADVASGTSSTTDRAVRAATALASAHLAAGDRVAAVLATPELLWTTSAAGRRHLLRVVELLVTAGTRTSQLAPDVQRVPRRVLTPGALVVVVTALASSASLALVADVRRRGHPTVVVEVVPGLSVPDRPAHRRRLIRLWLLQRDVVRDQMRARGVVVVSWGEGQSLAGALAPARRVRLAPARGGVAS